MSEIDPVILELRADLGKYRADLQSTTSQVQRLLGNQEKSAQRLEAQMRKSSGAIGASLRGLAGTLGTYFTGRELTGLIDSFTRLQNQLRVSGLEGEGLLRVQTSLLDMSSRYGVSIEELANLYGKSSQAASELGASEAQLLQITEASAQALKITGTSAVQAQGALLGLTQALSSGTVRAEEFNQINEGGLRPLLQAAANAERFGGSVAKLRQAVVDGKFSSQEFYQAILAGSAELEGKASKATLTLAGAFEALTSRLTVYIGEGAKANGITQALASGLELLADNIETIIPALAIIATAMGGRLVAAALAGGTAMRTLAAYASIATTSLAGTALAARSAGAALLGAFGGPIGLAITGVVLGLGYMASEAAAADAATAALRQETEDTANRLDEMADKLEKAGVKTDEIRRAAAAARGDVSALADEFNRASREAHKMADAYGAAALKIANLKIQESQARQAALQGQLRGQTLGGTTYGIYGDPKDDTRKRLDEERAFEAGQRGVINAVTTAFANGVNISPDSGGSSAPSKEEKKKKDKKGPKDRTEELAARAAQDLYQLQIEELRAKSQIATDATERASIEREILGKERDAREADIEAAVKSGDLTKQQADLQREILATLYGRRDAENAEGDILVQAQKSLYAMQIAREERLQLFEEEKDLAQAQFSAQSDALRQQYDLAKSQAERRNLAYEIIRLEYEYRDAQLEATKNNKDLSKAIRDRAAIEQAALRESQGRTMESARRDTAGPLEDYFDNAKKDANELNEAYQQIAVDGLGSVTDALTETATGFLKLGGTAGKVIDGIISDLIRLFIQQQITGLFGSLFGPSAASKQGAASGIAAGVGKFFGRASGGWVAPGQTVRVNEQRGGAEYLRMGSKGGTVIPLGQVNQQASRDGGQSGGVVRIIVEEGPGFASTVRAEAAGVAVEVVRATAPSIIQGAVGETQRQMSRPRMPGAGR